MEADPTKAYNQDYVRLFIRLDALRLKIAAKVQRKKNEHHRAELNSAIPLFEC